MSVTAGLESTSQGGIREQKGVDGKWGSEEVGEGDDRASAQVGEVVDL